MGLLGGNSMQPSLRLAQLNDLPWLPHPTLDGVYTKVFENIESHPAADVFLAQVLPEGVIPWHRHEHASETAYVLSGEAALWCNPSAAEPETATTHPLTVGSVFTVAAGVWHALENLGSEPLILFAFHTPPTF